MRWSSSRSLGPRHAQVLVALAALVGCTLDEGGLGSGRDGGQDRTGAAGANGAGGTNGPAGTGGDPSGAAGSAGAAGETGAAGTGAAGKPACGHCQPCFKCMDDACEPDPSAAWSVICRSVMIAPLKPTGAVWDTLSAAPPGTWPDTTCGLSVPDGRMRTTELVMDSLTPVWNAPVTPTSGEPLTSKFLMSPLTHWRITITDLDTTGSDTVCTTLPVATAADLRKGAMTLMDVGSCDAITLGFTCTQGPGAAD